MNNVASPTLTVRRITTADNAAIARVIRQVSAEYGLTADKGYTVADPNLDELYQVYSQPGAAYWVVEQNGCVWAAAAWRRYPVANQTFVNCKKCIFTGDSWPGAGEKAGADGAGSCREQGFKRCYLETTAFLREAIALYERLGFEHISEPLGCTGHVDCEVRMLKDL
ncbi:acetyltransferase [Salmonella enterica subsp. enterica]|nr:acetyltransferase [Salmonella enterica subsp. enterica]